MKTVTKDALKGGILRMLRVGIALAVSVGASYVAKEPKLVFIAPLLSGIAKSLRNRWDIDWLPL